MHANFEGEPMTVTAPVRPETDRSWFEEAVRRHYRLVFAIAWQALGSAADAEDATQEAFLRAYRARETLEAREALESWLARIARNTAMDFGRRRGRDDALLKAALSRAGAEAPEPGGAEAADEAARVRAAIAGLPEAEALVVTLRFLEDLSAGEIAARLGEAPGTVRVRLHRALKRLRGVIGEGGAT